MEKETIYVSGYLKTQDFNHDKAPEDIKRILIKTPFERYSDDIYSKMYQITHSSNVVMLTREKTKATLESDERKLNIAQSLLVLKTANKQIKVSSEKNEVIIDASIKNEIEKVLEQRFIDEGLALTPMTFEEGEEILHNMSRDELCEFVTDYWNLRANELGLTKEERDAGINYDDIDDEMVDFYIDGLMVQRDVTPEIIKFQIELLEDFIECDNQSLQGAPPKRKKIFAVIWVFTQYKKTFPTKTFNVFLSVAII